MRPVLTLAFAALTLCACADTRDSQAFAAVCEAGALDDWRLIERLMNGVATDIPVFSDHGQRRGVDGNCGPVPRMLAGMPSFGPGSGRSRLAVMATSTQLYRTP